MAPRRSSASAEGALLAALVVVGVFGVLGALGCGGEASPHPPDPGARGFAAFCAPCHGTDGGGIDASGPGTRPPPLDRSPWVAGPPDRLVRIVLDGLHGPIEIDGAVYDLEMPAFRLVLSDADIASVLSHVRRRFAGIEQAVAPAEVARVRQATEERGAYWTARELVEIDGGDAAARR